MLFWVQHLFFTLFYSVSVNMYVCIVNVIIIMTYSLYSWVGEREAESQKAAFGSSSGCMLN